MCYTHKWRLETPIELSVSTVSPSLFVAEDQARSDIESINVVYSQTNSSVGVMKKKKMEVPISVYNCSGVF